MRGCKREQRDSREVEAEEGCTRESAGGGKQNWIGRKEGKSQGIREA